MDANLIAACAGASLERARLFEPHLLEGMSLYGISASPLRMAMFLANVGHESGRLATCRESLNYSVEALMNKFGRHRISEGDARAFGRTTNRAANQEAIANRIYGGEWGRLNLGNVDPGDGWRYRGAGLFQATGGANFDALTRRLARRITGTPDFVVAPERLAEPRWAALSACDFADNDDLNLVADTGNFDAYCDLVNLGHRTARNGDANGYGERLALFTAGKAALGIA